MIWQAVNIKRIISFCLTLIISVIGDLSAKNVIEVISKRGNIVVAMTSFDNPPFVMKNTKGELAGVDIDIAHRISKTLNVDLVLNRDAKSFDEVVEIVASGKADIGISKISYTLDRAKKVLYSEPYLVLKKTLLLNLLVFAQINKEEKSKTLRELFQTKAANIGVLKGAAYINYARKLFNNIKLVELESWDRSILEKFKKEGLLAVFRDELAIKEYRTRYPETALNSMIINLKIPADTIHIILGGDDFLFREWVNGFIAANLSDISIESILEKYKIY